jgi:hypothetical protein
LGALFNEIAEREPAMSRIDPQLAYRRGRACLRRRWAGLAGTPVLAVAAAAAVALPAGAAPPQAAARPATAPAAPSQFDPLDPYLSFGWLPPGLKLVAGDITPHVEAIDGGHKLFGTDDWNVSAYAAGQCHLTAQAKSLTCAPKLGGITAEIDGGAPAVDGHPAYWSGSSLIWQYAPGGWALLTAPFPNVPSKGPKRTPALVRQAVKIASNVQYGKTTPPLVFPLRLPGLPSKWRVSSVFYVPKAGVLTPRRFALTSGKPEPVADGGVVYQDGLPTFDLGILKSCPKFKYIKGFSDKSKVKTVNGHRVVLNTLPRPHNYAQTLCAAHADGMSLNIRVEEKNPPLTPLALFRAHLKLLGPDPAGWTRQPIG